MIVAIVSTAPIGIVMTLIVQLLEGVGAVVGGTWDNLPTMPRLQSSLLADRLILTKEGMRVRSDSLPAGTEYILMQQDFELFQDGIGIVPCCLIRVQTDVWVAVRKALDNATKRHGEQF